MEPAMDRPETPPAGGRTPEADAAAIVRDLLAALRRTDAAP